MAKYRWQKGCSVMRITESEQFHDIIERVVPSKIDLGSIEQGAVELSTLFKDTKDIHDFIFLKSVSNNFYEDGELTELGKAIFQTKMIYYPNICLDRLAQTHFTIYQMGDASLKTNQFYPDIILHKFGTVKLPHNFVFSYISPWSYHFDEQTLLLALVREYGFAEVRNSLKIALHGHIDNKEVTYIVSRNKFVEECRPCLSDENCK